MTLGFHCESGSWCQHRTTKLDRLDFCGSSARIGVPASGER